MASAALARERLEIEQKSANLALRQRAANMKAAAEKLVSVSRGKVKAALEDGRTNVGVGAGARTAGIFGEALIRRKLDEKYANMVGPAAAVGAVACFTLAMSSKSAKDIAMYNAMGSVAEGFSARFFVKMADDLAANIIKG